MKKADVIRLTLRRKRSRNGRGGTCGKRLHLARLLSLVHITKEITDLEGAPPPAF
ncbi:hypothetical protein COLO4_18594 [Corchorus olitorius]|uniref:Uncharacterized protein n=1 Tax=Corchorus olitorius TaxID=93759 RepID=A0A1R3J8I0_9ROSI|nr:hypothetical protein COLO4_18594 [Corchorus olitorius]